MRIATWNVERLAHKKKLDQVLFACKAAKADILVLTETDEQIQPEYRYRFCTPFLKGVIDPVAYGETENRVSVFTNYECIGQYQTYDEKTAICVELVTEMGNLIVYGMITGIAGNRRPSYAVDLKKQLEDISRLVDAGHSVCVVGDYNCTFSDSYYYTKLGRESVMRCFGDKAISVLTANRAECVDHIAISDAFLRGRRVAGIEEWNQDRSLSDHKGIVVEIE